MALTNYVQFYKPWFTSTPKNAKKATGVLTVSGTVKDTEYFAVNGKTYEFASDAAQSVTSGRIPINIQDVTVAAQGKLTIKAQPTAGDQMVIGAKTYTFVAPADFNADGEISIGTSLATAQAAIRAAINGTDNVNTSHPLVSAGAFASDDCILTAKHGGADGNSIITTETFTAVTNVFDAGTLGTTRAGTDCAAADAVTKIVAAITANDTGVVAADGAGNTVDFSSAIVGTEGNDIATTENMANASFAATKLSGGQYATPSKASAGFIIISGNWYICVKPCDKYTTDAWVSAALTVL
jgi:hypothetical protein